MSQRNIFFIVLGFLILGLAVYGYFKATPENQTGNAPKIEISASFFDFGEVEHGQVLERSFVVKNTGQDILKIKSVRTSCSCTEGKIEKNIIEPGQETNLLVTYDTGAMSGPHGKGRQERIIFIQSNDPLNSQVEVKITALVQ